MAIYVTGDTHGTLDAAKLEPGNFSQGQELGKDDYLIIAGDFGLVMDDSDIEHAERRQLSRQPWTTLFVDGNHENFDMLDEFSDEPWHGGLVQRIAPSILHLERGHVFDIDGMAVFAMGGAQSVDAGWQDEGYTWWPEEMPNEAEMAEAERNLAACGWKVDAVITHDCSARILRELYGADARVNDLNLWLDSLEDKLDFDTWYFGHHHQDLQVDGRHVMLYESIERLT